MIYILSLFITVSHADSLDQACKVAARTYRVNYKLLKAISIVESGGGKRVQLQANKNGTKDAGPFQINSVHWNSTCKEYKVDTAHGGALCAAKILAGHYKHSRHDPEWYGLYHSKTPTLKHGYAMKIKSIMNKGESYVAVQK